jgi:hypothetical protein
MPRSLHSKWGNDSVRQSRASAQDYSLAESAQRRPPNSPVETEGARKVRLATLIPWGGQVNAPPRSTPVPPVEGPAGSDEGPGAFPGLQPIVGRPDDIEGSVGIAGLGVASPPDPP